MESYLFGLQGVGKVYVLRIVVSDGPGRKNSNSS